MKHIFAATKTLDEQKLSVQQMTALRTVLRSSSSGILGMSKTYSFPITYHAAITSTAGAVINNSFADNTYIASGVGWTQLSIFFDECRLRKVQFWIEPTNKYSKTVALSRPICVIYDDDSVGTLSTYDLLYGDIHTSNTDDMWHHPVTFKKPSDAAYLNEWQTTTSLAFPGGLMFYANALSASTNYGDIWIRYWLDFRQIA
jgi:hypothetical protein